MTRDLIDREMTLARVLEHCCPSRPSLDDEGLCECHKCAMLCAIVTDLRALPAVEPDYHLAALELHLQSHAAPLICDDCKRDARAIVDAALRRSR